MRYTADEKLEIIRLVESSYLGVKRTLDKLGVARPTFYRWYERYLARGKAGLNNRYRGPARPWNRLPEQIRGPGSLSWHWMCQNSRLGSWRCALPTPRATT